jgi:pyridoxal phosphate enzyme (YggS family)
MHFDIPQNLSLIHHKISAALQQYGRPAGSVKLLAVSKGQPAAKLKAAFAAGQRCFGENYLQEALLKMQQLQDLSLEWHFIGHIQSNKTAQLAKHFDWVQTVSSLSVAERLSRQRPSNLPPLNVCIQVNISGEASKDGVPPAAVQALGQTIKALPHLHLRGLMAIPAPEDDFNAQRVSFGALRKLFDQLNQAGLNLDTLSMGMSADIEAAIAEGSTLVRIGTDIFGKRT